MLDDNHGSIEDRDQMAYGMRAWLGVLTYITHHMLLEATYMPRITNASHSCQSGMWLQYICPATNDCMLEPL